MHHFFLLYKADALNNFVVSQLLSACSYVYLALTIAYRVQRPFITYYASLFH